MHRRSAGARSCCAARRSVLGADSAPPGGEHALPLDDARFFVRSRRTCGASCPQRHQHFLDVVVVAGDDEHGGIGAQAASVLESSSSDLFSLPMISAVVITLRTSQASAITAAALALVPALDTITTRSALATSSTRSLVRPARSESQAFIDQPSPLRGAPSNLSEVKKLARCHLPCASRLTTASLGCRAR